MNFGLLTKLWCFASVHSMTVLLTRAHACLTVIKPFGLHLTQIQNHLSLSFSICVSYMGVSLWYYSCPFSPPIAAHGVQGLKRTDPVQLCSFIHQYINYKNKSSKLYDRFKRRVLPKTKAVIIYSRSCCSTPDCLEHKTRYFHSRFRTYKFCVTFSYENCETSNMAR